MTRHQHPEPRRLAKEAELMYQNTRARLVQAADGSFQWLEQLVSEGGKPYALAIVYPRSFPHERPKAFVVDPPLERGPHMLIDGSLCLFEEPRAEDVKCTALVVRNRAVTWMLAYEVWRATGVWAAPEHGSKGAVP